jgi:hypothetical protein
VTSAVAAADTLADNILADSLEAGSIQQEELHIHSHTAAVDTQQVEEGTVAVAVHSDPHIHRQAAMEAV